MEEPLIKGMMEGAAAYPFYLCSYLSRVLRQNGIYDPVNLDVDLWEPLTLDVAGGRMDRTTTTARLRELAETSVAA